MKNFHSERESYPDLQSWRGECFNLIIETGVLHEVGLRNTLEPDPDNTGVGSFRSRTTYFLDSQREFSCFKEFETRGIYVQNCQRRSGSNFISIA